MDSSSAQSNQASLVTGADNNSTASATSKDASSAKPRGSASSNTPRTAAHPKKSRLVLTASLTSNGAFTSRTRKPPSSPSTGNMARRTHTSHEHNDQRRTHKR